MSLLPISFSFSSFLWSSHLFFAIPDVWMAAPSPLVLFSRSVFQSRRFILSFRFPWDIPTSLPPFFLLLLYVPVHRSSQTYYMTQSHRFDAQWMYKFKFPDVWEVFNNTTPHLELKIRPLFASILCLLPQCMIFIFSNMTSRIPATTTLHHLFLNAQDFKHFDY